MNSFLSKTYNILANNIGLKLLYLLSSFIFITSLSNIPHISILTKISIIFSIALIPIGIISSILDFKNNKIVYILIYSFLLLNLLLVLVKYPAIENIKAFVINIILLLVFFSVNTTKSNEGLKKDIYMFSSFYTMLTLILSSTSLILIYLNINPDLAGLFGNENALGIAAGISLILSIYILLCSKKTLFKIINLINVIIQFITIVTAGGRSSYLLLLVPIFILILINIKSKLVKCSMILIPLISFFALLFSAPNISRIIFTGRENIWKATFNLIKQYPLRGVGNDRLVFNLHSYTSYELNGIEAGGCHNMYLQIAAVNGLVLALIFIVLLFAIILPIYKYVKAHKTNYEVMLLFSLIIGILLVNMLESSLIYNVSFISITFWSISSYLLTYIRRNIR